jgi:hypothetical protein
LVYAPIDVISNPPAQVCYIPRAKITDASRYRWQRRPASERSPMVSAGLLRTMGLESRFPSKCLKDSKGPAVPRSARLREPTKTTVRPEPGGRLPSPASFMQACLYVRAPPCRDELRTATNRNLPCSSTTGFHERFVHLAVFPPPPRSPMFATAPLPCSTQCTYRPSIYRDSCVNTHRVRAWLPFLCPTRHPGYRLAAPDRYTETKAHSLASSWA